jgi:DNA-directed RNA polymerase subunit RPC12/RpoP
MDMTNMHCPGSLAVREPKPETLYCPKCGNEVEIWTDERMARCRNCGAPVLKDRGASCLDWCKMSKECVGETVYQHYLAAKIAPTEKVPA